MYCNSRLIPQAVSNVPLRGVGAHTISEDVARLQSLARCKLQWIAGLLTGALVFSGCGGPYDASVSGVVTLDGQIVPRGTVAFHPTDGGPVAYAPIRSDGSYVVRTGREEGLPSGPYQVTVMSNELPAQLETKEGRPQPPGKAITPPWYCSKETSGLQFTVEPGTNEIDLRLTSQPPPGWKPGQR